MANTETYCDSTRLRVVIPGGSGQVGEVLARHFHDLGHAVTVLSRRPKNEPWQVFPWDGKTLGNWIRVIDGADVVINLAGRNVNCRYTERNRREIMDSRVNSSRIIGQAVAQAKNPPALWMNASTATIYRHALDRSMDEFSGEIGGNEPGAPSTWRFSIDVATAWERAFFTAPTPHTRKIALRSAMTMSPSRGGIFATLLTLVRAGLGGKSASGQQFISWVHEQDFLRAIDFLIARKDIEGVVNVCSPNPVPNRTFMHDLRQTWGIRFGLPAAKWMLEAGAIVLQTETELILKSRRVVPARLVNSGFSFDYPEWPAAAQDLVKRWRANYSR